MLIAQNPATDVPFRQAAHVLYISVGTSTHTPTAAFRDHSRRLEIINQGTKKALTPGHQIAGPE